MDSGCSHIDRGVQKVPADRARAAGRLVHQARLGRGCSADRTSYWGHTRWGLAVEGRVPTGREDDVEKARPWEGHRGSRRGRPDCRNERIEAFAVAASVRALVRVCCGTCGGGLRGRACAVQTCGAKLGVHAREVRGLGRRGASPEQQDGRPSLRGRSRQPLRCSPTPRPLLPRWCIPPGCQTRPGRPRSLLLRR